MLKYINLKETKKGSGFIKNFKKILKLLLVLAIILPITTFIYYYVKLDKIFNEHQEIELKKTNTTSNNTFISNEVISNDNITNILLIGTDARSQSEQGRSDSMIIATLDEKHKSIKLTSLARDTYVAIPGYGEQKLNHAYSYGGVELLRETIEYNLCIEISNHMIVDFSAFSHIIDALGGVTLDVEKGEISELNKYIPECYNVNYKHNSKKKIILVENPGIQTLNGYQTLSYSRIRKNDSALERDRRQRKVLQAIMHEVSNISILEIPKLIKAVFPYVETNLSISDAIDYTKKIIDIGNFDIKQFAFPIPEHMVNENINGKGWVLTFDRSSSLPLLHDFIFEDDEFLKNNKVYCSLKELNSKID